MEFRVLNLYTYLTKLQIRAAMKVNNFCIVLHLLFIIFLLSSFQILQAQSWYRVSNSIDLVLGGDYGFTIIDHYSSYPDEVAEYSNRSQFETFKLNYRVGLNYMHGLNQNFSLKTGLRFANPGFSISGVDPFDPNEDINTIQKEVNNTLDRSEYRYNYHLIEVPLGLRYTLTKSYCEPFFEIGVSANYYWRTIVEEIPYEGNMTRTTINEKINKVNYIGFLSMGGQFPISDQLSGFTQLIGRYQLNNLREGQLVEKIFGLGIEIAK